MNNDYVTTTATGSSLVLSAIAAFIGLCCIGPIAVALFGVTGAVFLARLEPARPYFISVASILVVVTATILYIYPLLKRQTITRNQSQHAFFVVSSSLVLFAVFADQILWYLR